MNANAYLLELRSRLRDCHATQAEIAAASGELSLSWVSKFNIGKLTNPSIRSLLALEMALDQLAPDKAA
jgi:transcriptional regulator with XRE-family HTH domain